ncbi:MAG: hypothetical protein F4056_09220 [Chloroflexi bacterium]|nr:hypothetical protein [Chloroflexota bacterium]
MWIRQALSGRTRARAPLALAALVAGTLALACGDGGTDEPAATATAPPAATATREAAAPTATATATAAAPSTGDATATPEATAEPTPEERTSVFGEEGFEASYPQYEDEASGLILVFGTPDLGLGPQRIAFVLSDSEGIVRLPIVSISASLGGGEEVTAIARYFDFPEGIRGLYVGELEFDQAGEWLLEVSLPRPDGSLAVLSFPAEVAERTLAPDVGDPAPASLNRTLDDVESIYQLSTGAEPDPALYELTVAEALEAARPFVIVFASPGFCTNALCGPQAEILTVLRERHGDRANFIHVDLYENPEEIRTMGLGVAIETPLLREWGLHTPEWTFIVGADGLVAGRFEAFAPEEELEEALIAVLDGA